MKKIYLIIFLLMCVNICFYKTVYPFSLSDIDVKNNFGERFNAEIILQAEESGSVDVSFGSRDEYQLFGLKRNSVLDKLSLTINPLDKAKGLYAININSKEPLYYPSFYLVIKAANGGNSIIEKYLLTVDLKQSVSIGGLDKALAEKKYEPIGLNQLSKDNEEGIRDPELEEKPGLPVKKAETDLKKDISKETNPFDRTENKTVTVFDGSPQKTKPAEQKVSEKMKDKGIVKKDITRNTQKKVPVYYGPVSVGETLFAIANNIGIDKSKLNRVVVSLWKKNKRAFNFSNLNGLKKGSKLDYSSIDKDIEFLNEDEAKKIIRKQWHLWLGKLNNNSNKNITKSFKNIIKDDKGLYSTILNWKESWEAENIENQMKYYSSNYYYKGQNWLSLKVKKKKFNDRHNNIRIDIDKLSITRLPGKIVKVSYEQRFKSNKMETLGIKSLKLKYEKERWQIIEEGWNKMPEEKVAGHPYVLHIASFRKKENAVYEVSRWRDKGFSAYYLKDNVRKKGEWYRVFIERISGFTPAKDLAEFIKRNHYSDYALEMHFPYSIEVLTNKNDTMSIVAKLNDFELSPFLFSQYEKKKGINHKLLVGAYESREKAEGISQKLVKAGLEAKVIAP